MPTGDILNFTGSSDLEKLKMEKELVDQALDNMADTFFIFEIASGRALKWNRTFREQSGYSDEEIRDMKFPDDWFDEFDSRRAALAIEENLNKKCPPQELALITKNGNRIAFEYTCSVLKNHEGKPCYIAAIGRDATERNLVEDYLSWQLKITAALTRLYKPAISSRCSQKELFPVILEEALKMTGSKHGYVSRIDPQTKCNVIKTDKRSLSSRMETYFSADDENRLIMPLGKDNKYPGMPGRTLNAGEGFYVNKPESDTPGAEIWTQADEESGFPRERFLSVPIYIGGAIAGQIALANIHRDYNERDLEAVQRIVSFASLAMQRPDSQ